MNIDNNYEYTNKEIEEIFYLMLPISNNLYCRPQTSIDKENTYILNGQSITAACNTLISIDFMCGKGHFTDAYVLLRKYRDDLIQYLFLSYVIDNIKGLSDLELEKSGNITWEELYQNVLKELSIKKDGTRKSNREFAVEAWMNGTLTNKEFNTERKNFFDTSKYRNVLKEDKQLELLVTTYLDDLWKKLDRVLNNYVHGNGGNYILDNYPSFGNFEIRRLKFIKCLRDVTSIFISMLTILMPSMIQSSDYADYMDLGAEPPEGCECWVAPVVIEYMENYFKEIHPDLIHFLNDNNKYGMKICV